MKEERIPVLRVWQTEKGLEVEMLKTLGNNYLVLGLLEEIKHNILSGNLDEMEAKAETEAKDSPPRPFGKFDA